MVLAVEKPLQRVVNTLFRGREPYTVARSTVLLLLLLRVLRSLRRILRNEGVKAYVVNWLAPSLKRLPPIRRKLAKEMQKTTETLRESFAKEVTAPRRTLPIDGVSERELLDLLTKRKELDTKHWNTGKITGAVYHGGSDHCAFIGDILSKWAFANPLHPGIHPALRQMDAEVIQMAVNMYNGGSECCGAFSTGGTESILLAIKAYRDQARAVRGITDPNVVCCVTAHAAFDKAGSYFGVFVRKARATASMEVDVQHVRSLIDANTIAIVGSACQYAHGTVDPIPQLAELALKRGVGLHVDCCLGGFLVPFMEKAGFPLPPFDFRLPGVTSISCDPHKYGFAPKGSSVVMFSTRNLRHYMYSAVTKWTGGIYATATMTGSRSGGPVAATWAAMCKFGEKGYVETTKQIVGATRHIAACVEQIQGLQLVGRPDVCVVAFTGKEGFGVNCYAVADCVKQMSGWELATCQNPPCVHLALTLPTARNAAQFLVDLQDAVEVIRASKEGMFSSTAGLYGMAASLPAAFLDDAAAAYLDAMGEATLGS